MKVKCQQDGIFFKGQKLKKDNILEIENKEELGKLEGLFEEIENLNNLFEKESKIEIKKHKFGGKR